MQRRVHDHFSLEKLPEHHIFTMTNALRCDIQWWKTKYRWLSVDAHLNEGAQSVSQSFLPITPANTLTIYRNDHIAFHLRNLQDQKLLTLHWHSISESGREGEARSFTYKASQYHIYEWSQLIAKQITNDTRPNIVDAPLTLILPWAYPQYVII